MIGQRGAPRWPFNLPKGHAMTGRTALFISVLLNLLLIGTVIRMATVMAHHDSKDRIVSVPPAVEQTVAPEPAAPFRWSQIESTNYLTYVSNLRSIGCPERTIRDLIVADVESLYGPRRDRLRQRSAGFSSGLAGRLDELGREETNLISYILSSPSPMRQTDDTPVPASSSTPVNDRASLSASQAAPSLPLAFTSVDTNFVQLNDRQWGLIQNLQRGFVDELGGAKADPASADYAERWSKAQPEYDEMLEVILGREGYIEFQKQAAVRRPQGN
jgi:hypothetical protein